MIDIVINYFEIDKMKFIIFDVFGYCDFVLNMIVGVSQVDFVIFVIDGNIGVYEKGLKGQMWEYVLFFWSFGVQ